MNKPRIATYVLGNGPVAFGLMAMFAVSAYLWWIGRVGGELAFVSLVVAAWAQRANDELTRYRQWQAQWDSYGQPATGSSSATRRPSARQLTLIGLLATWGYLLTTVRPNKPNTAFAWFTLALIGYGLVALVTAAINAWRRRRARRTDVAKPDYILVEVCAASTPTPTLHKAYELLPDYCYLALFPDSTDSA